MNPRPPWWELHPQKYPWRDSGEAHSPYSSMVKGLSPIVMVPRDPNAGREPYDRTSREDWMSDPDAVKGDILYVLRNHRDHLTDWEKSFLSSVSRQHTFSMKQVDTVNKIMAKLGHLMGR